MKLYEVLEDNRGGCEDTCYGKFSTYEKANESMKELEDIDGFGICADDLCIKEVEIIPDKIEDWVLKLVEMVNNAKRNMKKGMELTKRWLFCFCLAM